MLYEFPSTNAAKSFLIQQTFAPLCSELIIRTKSLSHTHIPISHHTRSLICTYFVWLQPNDNKCELRAHVLWFTCIILARRAKCRRVYALYISGCVYITIVVVIINSDMIFDSIFHVGFNAQNKILCIHCRCDCAWYTWIGAFFPGKIYLSNIKLISNVNFDKFHFPIQSFFPVFNHFAQRFTAYECESQQTHFARSSSIQKMKKKIRFLVNSILV